MVDFPSDAASPTSSLPPSPENESGFSAFMARAAKSLGFVVVSESKSLDPSIMEKSKEIDEIIADLHGMIEEMEMLDASLQSHLISYIRPLERQLRKVKATLEEKADEPVMNSWISKAKAWTQLRGKPLDPIAITTCLIRDIRREVESSIQQDFNIIRVYLHNRMNDLGIKDSEKKEIEDLLKKPLTSLSDEIRTLVLMPGIVTLQALSEWRTQVDTKRQKHQEAALNIIDEYLKKS